MATPWYAFPITQAHGQHGEKGVDLGTPFHTPITALFAGTVRFSGRTEWSSGGSSGGEVTIVCNVPGVGLLTSYYLHTDINYVKESDTVQAGQLIALSGGQLSGGNWPVQNTKDTTFSYGPHTEFGFNAPWVSGPGHLIDPTPYILAAKGGRLPNTNPDGTASFGAGAIGATPVIQTYSPTFVETALASAYTVAASTRKTITKPTGWDGICQWLDYNESMVWNPLNPFGSFIANLTGIGIMLIGIIIGLTLLFIAMWPIVKPIVQKIPVIGDEVGQRGGAGGEVLGGSGGFAGAAAGKGGGGGSVLAEAPEAAAL